MTLAAASAVCVDGVITADQVVDLVGGLVYRSLLEVSPPSRPGGPSHYRQLVADPRARVRDVDRIR